MLLQSLKLTNLLSFGPDTAAVELRPLNVLIGPNGSGKSNFIEAIGLLRAAPREIAVPIREGGGVEEWIWKGSIPHRLAKENPTLWLRIWRSREAALAAVLCFQPDDQSARYLLHQLSFVAIAQRFELFDELLEDAQPPAGTPLLSSYFSYEVGQPLVGVKGSKVPRALKRESLHPERSILAQLKDPEQYPELAFVSAAYESIALYREWSFGRSSPPRLPQRADLPNDHLLENAQNLGLILNRFRTDPPTKQALIEAMQQVFDGIVDFAVQIEGGTVQVFLEEASGWSTPASRLSDGTLRWLSLLAVLLDPKPQRLVCIEEPELGLHPDLIPVMARLLKDASARMQVIVTTHSEVLIDALSECPEDVLVCERQQGSTTMRRLDRQRLAEWLSEYRLGQLWSKGVLGGNRW